MTEPAPPRTLKLFGREMPLPRSRAARITVGVLLICGGCLFFLPVLGLWMLPLGILVLSYEFASVRRFRRRVGVWWGRRQQARSEAKRQRSAS